MSDPEHSEKQQLFIDLNEANYRYQTEMVRFQRYVLDAMLNMVAEDAEFDPEVEAAREAFIDAAEEYEARRREYEQYFMAAPK